MYVESDASVGRINTQLTDGALLKHSPKNFNVEQRSMEKTYWNLQKRLHPDLYGSKSEVIGICILALSLSIA